MASFFPVASWRVCHVCVIEEGMVGGGELIFFSVDVEKQVAWLIIEVFVDTFKCFA